jgi:ribonuclease P protein component
MNDETAGPRLGITASRKVGAAVARNRARRRLRAVASQVLRTHAVDACDYVIIARASTVTRPFAALLGDLAEALRRLNMLRPAGERRSPA